MSTETASSLFRPSVPTVRMTYAAVLATASIGLLSFLTYRSDAAFHGPLTFACAVGFTMFVVSWGFPLPMHTGLDRVAQVAAILAFGPLEAAWINAAASFLWPFTSRAYNRGSWSFALARGLHNSGMFALMVLGAGSLYQFAGGSVPLLALGARDALAILLMALVMQAVNTTLMMARTRVEGGDPHSVYSRDLALFELATVPAGVLTALLYERLDAAAFILYLALLVALVVVVNRFAATQGELRTRLESLLAVTRVSRAVSSSLVLDKLAELIHAECRKLFRFNAFYLVLVDEQSGDLDFRLHYLDCVRQPRRRKVRGSGLIGWVIESRASVLIEDWSTADPALTARAQFPAPTPASLIAVPMKYDEHLLGAIVVYSDIVGEFGRDERNLLLTFGDQVAVAIANARLFDDLDSYKHELERKVEARTHELREANAAKEQLLAELREKSLLLERQSKEDALTGLANRRQLDEQLTTEITRAERFAHPLSVALADLDHFKQVNDTHGHALGDEVLRIAAAVLRSHCRSIDVVARWGGEEFALVFPETDAAGARVVCEKIREALAGYAWQGIAPGIQVTLSIGVAEAFPGMDGAGAFARADANLYEAKRAGRNRVVG